jgi:hypothetical protein
MEGEQELHIPQFIIILAEALNFIHPYVHHEPPH